MRRLFYIFVFMLSTVFVGCINDAPELLISENDMESILYDLSVVQSMPMMRSQKQSEMSQLTYRHAVFRKYGVTEEQWDSSYNYYCRHVEKLSGIYQNVMSRLQNDIIANGGNVSDMTGGFAEMDTANVWQGGANLFMMANLPYNVRSFKLDVDTSYHAGDKFQLSGNASFLFENGARDLVCVVALKLSNDSVVGRTNHISQDGRFAFEFSDESRKGIKAVTGYLMLSEALSDKGSNSMRVVLLNDIKLVRMHTDSKAYDEKLRRDSIENARRDSIRNAEMEQSAAEDEDSHEETPETPNTTNKLIKPINEEKHIPIRTVTRDMPVRTR